MSTEYRRDTATGPAETPELADLDIDPGRLTGWLIISYGREGTPEELAWPRASQPYLVPVPPFEERMEDILPALEAEGYAEQTGQTPADEPVYSLDTYSTSTGLYSEITDLLE